MQNWYAVLTQAMGFLGLLFFCLSFQVKTNKRLFILQTLGCVSFCIQYGMLGAVGGCCNVIVNIARNVMLTRYNDSALVRWKGWAVIFSALTVCVALLTWGGLTSVLLVVGTVAGTFGSWTNNARKIRLANLLVNSPCLLIYDILVGSLGGVLNESILILSVIASILRFGWKALDGDTIGDADSTPKGA